MKQTEIAASRFEFACAHFSDHRTQKAKPTNHNHTDELCTFSSVGADVRRLASFSSPGGEDTDEGVPPFAYLAYFAVSKSLHFGIRTSHFDSHETLDFPTRNEFPKLNLKSFPPNHQGRSVPSIFEPTCIAKLFFVTTFRKAKVSCWAPNSWRAWEANSEYSLVDPFLRDPHQTLDFLRDFEFFDFDFTPHSAVETQPEIVVRPRFGKRTTLDGHLTCGGLGQPKA